MLTYEDMINNKIDLLIDDIACRLGDTLVSSQSVITALKKVASFFKTNIDLLQDLCALNAKHPYTYQHSLNVACYSMLIGKARHFNSDKLSLLCLGSILHDIGKLHISNSLLNKPSSLTREEFEVIKQHPLLGARIYCSTHREIDNRVLLIIRQHHEKLNGTGYPYGLFANKIDELSKIVAVADIFDAVTTTRAYHQGQSIPEGLNLLYSCAYRGELDSKIVNNLADALTHSVRRTIRNNMVS